MNWGARPTPQTQVGTIQSMRTSHILSPELLSNAISEPEMEQILRHSLRQMIPGPYNAAGGAKPPSPRMTLTTSEQTNEGIVVLRQPSIVLSDILSGANSGLLISPRVDTTSYCFANKISLSCSSGSILETFRRLRAISVHDLFRHIAMASASAIIQIEAKVYTAEMMDTHLIDPSTLLMQRKWRPPVAPENPEKFDTSVAFQVPTLLLFWSSRLALLRTSLVCCPPQERIFFPKPDTLGKNLMQQSHRHLFMQ
ncbi:hypothetical protein E4U43_004407 [Claviceps pusilla]|uniref:Uncharacterized protein n=1 Tax=Claviceps pusilla TaxID=123648 RepID=A0A9P7NFZ4_9HYPO|nr:hypothetical protein E4U43_004407 [Claviceps pusilla]